MRVVTGLSVPPDRRRRPVRVFRREREAGVRLSVGGGGDPDLRTVVLEPGAARRLAEYLREAADAEDGRPVSELPPDPVTGGDLADAVLDSLLDVIFRPEGRAPLEVAVAALSRNLVEGALLALLDRLEAYAAHEPETPGPNVLMEDPSWRALVALNDELEEVADDGPAFRSVIAGREEAELREMLSGVLRLLADRPGGRMSPGRRGRSGRLRCGAA